MVNLSGFPQSEGLCLRQQTNAFFFFAASAVSVQRLKNERLSFSSMSGRIVYHWRLQVRAGAVSPNVCGAGRTST